MSPVLNTAFRAADSAKDAASHTRDHGLQLREQGLKVLNDIRSRHPKVFTKVVGLFGAHS